MNIVIEPFKSFIFCRSFSKDVIFFSILLLLIPIVLITGPALPDIFLSLIALYFLLKSIQNKLWNYYKNPIFFGFIIFSSYGIIRSLFSDMPIESLTNEGSMFYFRYIFFSMGVWYLLDKNPYLSKCLLITSLLCFIVVSLDGIYQYLIGKSIFGMIKEREFRLTGLFGDEPIIGRYISYLSLFTFALIYQNLKITKKIILLSVVFLVVSEVTVFLSGERAPLLYITLFIFLIIIFLRQYRNYLITSLLVSIIILGLIMQINPTAKTRVINHSINEISETRFPFLPYNKNHEYHYISAIKLFTDNPIFGAGTNTYRYQCDKPKYSFESKCNSHPHHFYLQTLAELGFVGFLFISSFFLYLTYIGLKQLYFMIIKREKKQIPTDFLLFAMILFVFWFPFIPHMSLYNNWNNVLMMLPLGFFMRNFYSRIDNGNH